MEIPTTVKSDIRKIAKKYNELCKLEKDLLTILEGFGINVENDEFDFYWGLLQDGHSKDLINFIESIKKEDLNE